jgi:hypothetical protein
MDPLRTGPRQERQAYIILWMRIFSKLWMRIFSKPKPEPQFEIGDVVELTKIFAANTGGPVRGEYVIKGVECIDRCLYQIQSVRDGPRGRIAYGIPEDFLRLVRRHD